VFQASSCSGSRAGLTWGGSGGKPNEARIALQIGPGSTACTMRLLPPQSWQRKTSVRSLHDLEPTIPRWRVSSCPCGSSACTRGASVSSAADTSSAEVSA
jgi:hypothetical protein